jgi:hypothetical protein
MDGHVAIGDPPEHGSDVPELPSSSMVSPTRGIASSLNVPSLAGSLSSSAGGEELGRFPFVIVGHALLLVRCARRIAASSPSTTAQSVSHGMLV